MNTVHRFTATFIKKIITLRSLSTMVTDMTSFTFFYELYSKFMCFEFKKVQRAPSKLRTNTDRLINRWISGLPVPNDAIITKFHTGWLVGWLVCFTAYQYFSGYLIPNWVILIKVLNNISVQSWRQQPTRHQLYSHLPLITKTIQVRRTRHAGHCWRNRDELISDVLLWASTYGRAKAGRPARTYIQQLCEYTGCDPEDLPEAINDREKWRERVRDIRASGTT